jgi:hypothetical protein
MSIEFCLRVVLLVDLRFIAFWPALRNRNFLFFFFRVLLSVLSLELSQAILKHVVLIAKVDCSGFAGG